MEEKHRRELLMNVNRYYEDETIKDSIPLYGSRLDDFFDFYMKKEVELSIRISIRAKKRRHFL